MKERLSKYQRWQWNEDQIVIKTLKTGQEYRLRWSEIAGFRKSGLYTEDKKHIWILGSNEEETRQLKDELKDQWKRQYPCKWVSFARRGVKQQRALFLWGFPGFIFVTCVLPWLGMILFLVFKEVERPDFYEKCVRMSLAGVFFMGIFYLIFFFYIRKLLELTVKEAEKVEIEHQC